MRRAFGVARLILAGVAIVALIGYYDYVLGFATFAISNFFSYFTVQSGMAAVVVFITAAVVAFRLPADPEWLDKLRAMVTTYILVSGIVYAIIVVQSSTVSYQIEVPWSSQLLHFWVPVVALVDWLIDPYKARLSWQYLIWVLVFPILWLVFTLIRGPIVGWYPYFFLDSGQVSGPAETVFYSLIVIGIITGIAALLTGATHLPRVPPPIRRIRMRGR